MSIRFSKTGVELADVPGSGVSKTDPNARSGNPNHDTRSGKFGGGGGGGGQKVTPPANTDPLEYARMIDAVRDMAREFDDFDEGDVQEFIKGRANSPDTVDIQAFLKMAQEQRKNDLVDLLDEAIRSGGSLTRARRRVKIRAPRGFVRKAVKGLDGDTMAEIMHRLEAKGHDESAVEAFFDGRNNNLDDAKEKKAAIAASDSGWRAEALPPLQMDDHLPMEPGDEPLTAAQFAQFFSKMPQPQITVPVEIHMPSGKKKVTRNAQGLIETIEEE